jgi:hypothetical protein
MIKKVAIIFGMGGHWLDPRGGESYLVVRCKAIGLDTGASPYTYGAGQQIYDFLKDADWRAIVGDSFGADYGPEYARNLAPRKVDYLAGFQPSMYANDVRNGFITIPPNVVFAHCIRDPMWLDTGGLGFANYVAADPKKTKLIITEHRHAHPDDTGVMQDVVFGELLHQSEAYKDLPK